MQIVRVLDSTEQIHPADSASGLVCSTETNVFVIAAV